MPNKNYIRGRRFEYETMDRWRENYKVLRTAGSHGAYDVVAYNSIEDGYPSGHVPQASSVRETRRGYIYDTYIYPIIGYGIQCKVKKVRSGKKTAR